MIYANIVKFAEGIGDGDLKVWSGLPVEHTFLPRDGTNRIPSHRTLQDQIVTGHSCDGVHRPNQRKTVDVEPGGVRGQIDSVPRCAAVLAAIFDTDGSDIDV